MFVEEYLAELRARRYAPRAWAVYVRRVFARSRDRAARNPVLARSVLVSALYFLLAVVAAGIAFTLFVDRSLGLPFVAQSLAWLAGGVLWVLLHLGLLRAGADLPLSVFNVSNGLTLARLVAIPAVTVPLLAGRPDVAFPLYAAAALTDVVDGWYARRFRDETRMGVILDPLVDIAFHAALLVALARAGWIPGWVLALAAARYALLVVGGAAIYVFRGPLRVQSTRLGKVTGLAVTAMVASLFLATRLLPAPEVREVTRILHLAMGALFATTIVQAVAMGWFNLRRMGRAEADAARGRVVGHIAGGGP
jgi:phosphatidylglycerophosphate synthase